MIPTEVALVADLAAYWDSIDRDDTHIAFAAWLLDNLEAKGFSIVKNPTV